MAFDDLLTADRLDQLSRLVSPEQAAAGVLAGIPGGWSTSPVVGPDGTWVDLAGARQRVSDRVAPLLRAWCPLATARSRDPRGRRLDAAIPEGATCGVHRRPTGSDWSAVRSNAGRCG